jgi:hypothetical protein
MLAQDPPLFGRSAGICRLHSQPLILLASFQQLPNLVYAAGVRKSASCSSVKGAPAFSKQKDSHSGRALRPLFRGLHCEMSAFATFRQTLRRASAAMCQWGCRAVL